jgi:hypothetical protein
MIAAVAIMAFLAAAIEYIAPKHSGNLVTFRYPEGTRAGGFTPVAGNLQAL